MFVQTVQNLASQKGITIAKMIKDLGLGQGTFSTWKKRGTIPNGDVLREIADYFGVSVDYLLGEDTETTLPSNVRPVQTKRFPMLGNIACGEPIFADEDHETYIDASSDIKADFCLTAKGDSMIGARIHDGDVVFIRAQPTVNNGEIAAVIIDNDATLKRWYFYPDKAKLVLSPENPAFEPLVYIGEELKSVRCIGKAVCFMSAL